MEHRFSFEKKKEEILCHKLDVLITQIVMSQSSYGFEIFLIQICNIKWKNYLFVINTNSILWYHTIRFVLWHHKNWIYDHKIEIA